MSRSGVSLFKCLLLVLPMCWPAKPAHGFIDLAPTLARIVTDSAHVALVEVVEFDRRNHILVLKEVRALKGELAREPIRQDVASAPGAIVPRQILQWASPGARGVLFTSRNAALVCVGQGWYLVRAAGAEPWKLGADRPDLPLAYYGTVTGLTDGIERILRDQDAVITVVAHGADSEGASFDLALNRQNLPGVVRVQRIRANKKMPGTVMAAAANPASLIGPGAVDEQDLPALLEKLKSSDPLARAEAADDLRDLEGKARPAVAPLSGLLNDPDARVRLSAAATLLHLAPGDARALAALAQGLASADPDLRRAAARAVGFAGPSAAPLVDKLAEFLKLDDEALRITVLQAVSLLGPAAGRATEAVAALLDNPDQAIDAADALGRIGSAARPALPRLAKLLASNQPEARWAAVRAMSQIGGPDAHPAVDFMVHALTNATEIEGYNMMIYLALLGPVAADAAPTIRSVRIKNPVLPVATLWAMAPDQSFPWLGAGPFGSPAGRGPFGGGRGPGGPGGAGAGNDGGPEFAILIYHAYVHELGERLRPAARVLAGKIMDGTAGDIPAWGYKILACGPQDALGILCPHLADDDLIKRERAAVALGYMGETAALARDKVQAAAGRAATEREKRLLAWCLREISSE